MARSRPSTTPPPVMTWGRAAPLIGLAAAFDLVRIFFLGIVFFGPAMLAAACTYETSGAVSTISFGLLGTKTAALGCVGGVLAGVAAANLVTAGGVTAALGFFGYIMGTSIAFMGWCTLGIIIALTNRRLIVANAKALIPTLIGFGVTQLPFINFLPALTGTTARLYHTQIKTERAAYAAWETATAAARAKEQQEMLQLAMLEARREQEELLAQEAEQEEEIPDVWPEAA